MRRVLSVPWSLRPRNRAAAATCGHGRCDLPAILRVTQKSLAASDFFAAAEAKNIAISAAEWLRARLALAATVATAILRCDFCAAKEGFLEGTFAKALRKQKHAFSRVRPLRVCLGANSFVMFSGRMVHHQVLRSSSPATGVIWALRAQRPKKVRKWVPGASRPRGVEKVEKESKKSPKLTIF